MAGAIRLSKMRADQKGVVSVLAVVACIPVLALTAGQRRTPILTPTSRRIQDNLRPNVETAKSLAIVGPDPTETDHALAFKVEPRGKSKRSEGIR